VGSLKLSLKREGLPEKSPNANISIIMRYKKSAGGLSSLIYALKTSLRVGPFKMIRAMLRKNSCKTCALGMGGQKGGMRNELGRFPEVCKKSLQAMKSDMTGAIAAKVFQRNSILSLGQLGPKKLEELGRIPSPLYASQDETHLKAISWDEAFQKITHKMKLTPPDKSFFYFSGRSSNEAGFLLQLMARVYGTNHINNCSYYCHQASGVGLTKSIGSSTATVHLDDIEHCDLFILIGANPTSNHPRLLTSLRKLKKRGGKVIVINPVKEPGLVRFKIPSHFFSLLFGTKIADHYIQPHIGGDMALLYGVAKFILQDGFIETQYIDQFTQGFKEYQDFVQGLSWQEIIESSGVSQADIKIIADHYKESNNCVFSWAMGITHHLNGVGNVQNIVNLALLRGMLGKPHAGLLPLRGHSNVQGMGTMGVTPTLKKHIFEKIEDLGIKLPQTPGHDTMACMESAFKGQVDFAWCLGGNLYASNPDLTYASRALNKVGMMVYLNTTLNEGHFFGRGKETLILPVLARDEEKEMTTQESMFSMIRLSSGGPSRLQNLRSEVEIISSIGAMLFKEGAIKWDEMKEHRQIRKMIASTIPGLEGIEGIETIDQTLKEFTIPKRIHHTPEFQTPSKKALFATPPLPKKNRNEITLMTIRSEGQFNTVIYEEEDIWRGIKKRDIILLNPADIIKLKLKEGQRVSICSQTGRMDNIQVLPFDIKEGNALMYYPEANILVSRELDPEAKTPAYKSVSIRIEM
jgi:molybdopterin-dependent oxidoreductase alpha subunit